jgi:thiol-disulfide isomerase/thioredoxin
MAHTDRTADDLWVDEHLSLLTPIEHPRLDLPARLAEIYARRTAARSRRMRWGGAALAAAAICLSLPGARVFSAKCVAACVNATTRATQLWRHDEPEANRPRVVGSTLGSLAPNLLGADVDGRPVLLSSLRGHVVVVNFWATWCAPCQSEIPLLNSLQSEFGGEGLDVIGVSLDEAGWPAIASFRERQPIDYPVVLATDEVTAAFGGVAALPMSFVIDRDGVIVIKSAGVLTEGTYERPIEKLLGH